MAASKFNFTQPARGGIQLDSINSSFSPQTSSQAALCSLKELWIFLARSTTEPISSPNLALFLYIQILSHTIEAYNWKWRDSSSLIPNFILGSMIHFTHSIISIWDKLDIFKGHGAISHTWEDHGHWRKICSIVSTAFLHKKHFVDGIWDLFSSSSPTGSILQTIFHKRFLNLAWNLSFHRPLYSIFKDPSSTIRFLPFQPFDATIRNRSNLIRNCIVD